MREIKYSAGIVSKPFWYLELKKTAKLLNEGKSSAEIKNMSIKDNIYQAPTEYRAYQIFNCVIARLKTLDENLRYLLLNSDSTTAKGINIISIMQTDLLFFEFMHEVFREKLILGEDLISDLDMDKFFSYKKTQSPIIENWTGRTIAKLASSYIRILYDAGFIETSNKERRIIKPVFSYQLENYLIASGMARYLSAMTGETYWEKKFTTN